MTSNRYAPPAATVGEIVDEARAPRPRQVTWAVRLLWVSVIYSIPMFYLEATRAPSDADRIVGLVVELVFTAFGCYLFVCIGRGRNWARIVTLVLTVLSTAMVVFGSPLPSLSSIDGIASVLNTVSDIACMCLLFTPTASAWFRNGAGVAR